MEQSTFKFNPKMSIEETRLQLKSFSRGLVVAEVCPGQTHKYPYYIVGKIKEVWVYTQANECFVIFDGKNKNYSIRTKAFSGLCPHLNIIKTLNSFERRSRKRSRGKELIFGIFGGKISESEGVLHVCTALSGIDAACAVYRKTGLTEIVFDYIGKDYPDIVLF